MQKNIKKVMIKDVIHEQRDQKPYIKPISVMDIISQKYPESGEDYALQLWYKTYHNVFAKCSEKILDFDMETAHLVIDHKNYSINIRTGKITLI